MKKTRLLSAAAVTAVIAGLSACNPAGATPGRAASRSGAAATAAASSAPPAATGTAAAPQGTTASSGQAVTGVSTGPGSYIMQAMPAGTASFLRAADGRIEAQVSMFGLTPGSAHQVSAGSPAGPSLQFPALTAGPAGQAFAVLTPDAGVTSLPAGSRLVIRLGDADGSPLAGEPIAESPVLPSRPQPGATFPLQAVTVTADGTSFGEPSGRAQIRYEPAAETVAVTLTASGLTPGPHAAHIHLGSCKNQGPVKYMLADFTADSNGNITSQTRVVNGVTSIPGSGVWYLNIHEGGMSEILSNGTPTLLFRPMLCTDVTSVAVSDGTTAASGMPPAPMSPPVPSPTMPGSSPSPAPSYIAGTHW